MLSYTELRNLYGTITNNSGSANLTVGDRLMNDSIRRTLSMQDWDFMQKSANISTVAGQQGYTLPFDYEKMVDTYITLGTTKYIPRECPTQTMWDQLNQQSTFQSNFPEWYFINQGQILFYPIPSSTTANAITVNYQRRIVDLNRADYTTGTIAATNGSATLTGSGTTWTTPMIGRWIRITVTDTAASSGDGMWYEITGVASATSMTIRNVYNGTTITGGAYTIGQMSALPEAFQDLPVWEAATLFFTSINPYPTNASLYKRRFDELLERLKEDHGTRTIDPVIHDVNVWPQQNMNNFLFLS